MILAQRTMARRHVGNEVLNGRIAFPGRCTLNLNLAPGIVAFYPGLTALRASVTLLLC
jgi:hypothetical protein